MHIGDSLSESRYKILCKLGYGSYSTVWLTKDHLSGYVAIKILIADNEIPQNEVTLLETLSESPIHHPGRAYVMTLRDSFELFGPNGTHRCLVFDVMGPGAEAIANYLPVNITQKKDRSPADRSFPLWMAKTILRQVLQGIDFMYQNHIAHGDVQPGNILFGLQDLSLVDESALMQNMTPRDPTNLLLEAGISEPVQRLDGKSEHGAPKYLAMNQPLHDFVRFEPQPVVKISDLGAAFPFSEPPTEPLTPMGLRSPECICGAPIGPQQDIWSFGCLVYQFLTGYPLFIIAGYDKGEADEADDDHFLQFSSILGPLPRDLLSKWSRSSLYLDTEGRPRDTTLSKREGEETSKKKELDVQIDAVETKHEHGFVKPAADQPSKSGVEYSKTVNQNDADDADEDPDHPPLEDMFRRYKGPDIDEVEADVITNLVRSILQYGVQQRPTAFQLLKHPWFSVPSQP